MRLLHPLQRVSSFLSQLSVKYRLRDLACFLPAQFCCPFGWCAVCCCIAADSGCAIFSALTTAIFSCLYAHSCVLFFCAQQHAVEVEQGGARAHHRVRRVRWHLHHWWAFAGSFLLLCVVCALRAFAVFLPGARAVGRAAARVIAVVIVVSFAASAACCVVPSAMVLRGVAVWLTSCARAQTLVVRFATAQCSRFSRCCRARAAEATPRPSTPGVLSERTQPLRYSVDCCLGVCC